MKAGFEIMPHPSDIGISFWAEDLPGAFAAAARGLACLLGGTAVPRGERTVQIRVEGADRQELLYNWLSELLYYFDGEDLLITGCEVRMRGDDALEAECTGAEPPAPAEESYDVKAITYHQLAIDRDPDGWRGRYFVDI